MINIMSTTQMQKIALLTDFLPQTTDSKSLHVHVLDNILHIVLIENVSVFNFTGFLCMTRQITQQIKSEISFPIQPTHTREIIRLTNVSALSRITFAINLSRKFIFLPASTRRRRDLQKLCRKYFRHHAVGSQPCKPFSSFTHVVALKQPRSASCEFNFRTENFELKLTICHLGPPSISLQRTRLSRKGGEDTMSRCRYVLRTPIETSGKSHLSFERRRRRRRRGNFLIFSGHPFSPQPSDG